MATQEALTKKAVELVKKHPDQSMNWYADKLGISGAETVSIIWNAEFIADPKLKIPFTQKAIIKARQDGIRWERIAIRTGHTVGEVRNLGGDEANVYVGRGRNYNGATATKSGGNKRQSTGKKDTGKGTSGRRQQSQASGRGRGKANAGSGNKPRARTRAERMAKSGDPK